MFLSRESGLSLCSGLLLQHHAGLLVPLFVFSQTQDSEGEKKELMIRSELSVLGEVITMSLLIIIIILF